MENSLHSSYWLDDFSIGKLKKTNELDPIELAKYQRVISNFVQILTKKRIPIKYNASGDSYTDSHSVVIGSNISDRTFDSVVGLALHEGSHIKLTDFSILPVITSKVRDLGYEDFADYLNSWGYQSIGGARMTPIQLLRTILNYVEDRRIDYFVYTNSPGYKNYYKALYDRYFNHSSIDKGLLSDKYRDSSDVDSYLFRITNLVNKNSDLDALPGLKEIHNLIFNNVRTLSSTMESLDISIKVTQIILDNIKKSKQQSEQEDSNESETSETGEQSQLNGEGTESSEESGENTPSNEGGESSQPGESTSSESSVSSSNVGNEPSGAFEKLTERQEQMLEKKIKKQREFLEGKTSKRKVTKKLKQEVEAVAQSDMDLVDVQHDIKTWNDSTIKNNVKVVVMRGLNENSLKVLESYKYRYLNYNNGNGFYTNVDKTHKYVMDGVSLGKRLGRKLQIRNYETTTNINRQKKGRIDRRRLHAIGADDFNVFYQSQTEKYADAFLHLSIDGSGSMNGENFYNSLQSAVAIAQMGTMTNIDVQISLRITDKIGGTERPIMWIVYDSRKDTMSTIKKYFKFLDVCGYTPEGLCFNSIMKELPTGSDSLKTYFINYSDGMPYFNNYTGDNAVNHTRQQVNKLKDNGYNILSFFLTSRSGGSVADDFKTMYGESSQNINPTSLPKLVKVLQKMFVNNK